MVLVFVSGTEDVGPIAELAARGPKLSVSKVIHLTPEMAPKLLAKKPKNLIATLSLTAVNGEVIEFPYGQDFFVKNRPDLFILLESEGESHSRQRIDAHLALMSGAKAIKIIKIDKGNIKKALLDMRKTLVQVLE